jgi:hypothetical protein
MTVFDYDETEAMLLCALHPDTPPPLANYQSCPLATDGRPCTPPPWASSSPPSALAAPLLYLASASPSASPGDSFGAVRARHNADAQFEDALEMGRPQDDAARPLRMRLGARIAHRRSPRSTGART